MYLKNTQDVLNICNHRWALLLEGTPTLRFERAPKQLAIQFVEICNLALRSQSVKKTLRSTRQTVATLKFKRFTQDKRFHQSNFVHLEMVIEFKNHFKKIKLKEIYIFRKIKSLNKN